MSTIRRRLITRAILVVRWGQAFSERLAVSLAQLELSTIERLTPAELTLSDRARISLLTMRAVMRTQAALEKARTMDALREERRLRAALAGEA